MNVSASEARIRRMAAADLDRVMEIAGSLKEAPRWPRAAYQAAIDDEAGGTWRIALVAEIAGVAEGFAVASLLEDRAELEMIAVAQEHQRCGLARRLFGAMVEEPGLAEAGEVILEVRASNHAALGLYRSLGFIEAGRRPRYYVDPVEDAVLMSLLRLDRENVAE
jgi:ribosomal-protein-alanine N-acetyltransferase